MKTLSCDVLAKAELLQEVPRPNLRTCYIKMSCAFVISLLFPHLSVNKNLCLQWPTPMPCRPLYQLPTSSVKGLSVNFPLFMEHLNWPPRQDPFPALSEWATKELIIMELTRIFKNIWSHSRPKLLHERGSQPWWVCFSTTTVWKFDKYQLFGIRVAGRKGIRCNCHFGGPVTLRISLHC